MVTKLCPKCTQQVPVACKACPCGHLFFAARRPITIHNNKSDENRVGGGESGEVKRRRTERINRERPDYFNSLQVNSHLKNSQHKKVGGRHRGGNSTSSSTNDNDGEGSNSEENNGLLPRKRGRPKGSANKIKKDKGGGVNDSNNRPRANVKCSNEIVPKPIPIDPQPDELEEDLFSNLTAEKELQYSIILAEINRKLCAQTFKV